MKVVTEVDTIVVGILVVESWVVYYTLDGFQIGKQLRHTVVGLVRVEIAVDVVVVRNVDTLVVVLVRKIVDVVVWSLMTIFVVVTGNDVTYVNVVTEVDTIVVGIRVVEIAVVVVYAD